MDGKNECATYDAGQEPLADAKGIHIVVGSGYVYQRHYGIFFLNLVK